MKDNTLLITGATGSNGAEILKLLASRAIPARAMVRSRAKAGAISDLPGIEIVEGDFEDPASLERVLAGVERAFLVTNSSERAEAQQLAFVEAARQSGVKHLVNLSQFAAAANSPVRFLRYHAVVEAAVRKSGMAFTFLRPNLFMQALFAFRDTIVSQGRIFASAGDARVSVVDVRDIAASAVAALTEPGHEGKTYTLTGPEALTHAEMAGELSRALGKEIEFVDIPPEAMRDAMLQMQVPVWQADGIVEDYAHYRRGEASAVEKDVEEATGKPPRSFAAFARDYRNAFLG